MKISSILDYIDSGHMSPLVRPYERKQAAPETLKKTLLHQAFTEGFRKP